jgi:hypothetical protein
VTSFFRVCSSVHSVNSRFMCVRIRAASTAIRPPAQQHRRPLAPPSRTKAHSQSATPSRLLTATATAVVGPCQDEQRHCALQPSQERGQSKEKSQTYDTEIKHQNNETPKKQSSVRCYNSLLLLGSDSPQIFRGVMIPVIIPLPSSHKEVATCCMPEKGFTNFFLLAAKRPPTTTTTEMILKKNGCLKPSYIKLKPPKYIF